MHDNRLRQNMAELCFIALAITSLLPALSEGAQCANGQLTNTEISQYVLDPVNQRRNTLAAGNQKNGESGQNLPPPASMSPMVSHSILSPFL
ncbi:hypothetical protein ANCCAN_12567 [Ancylostoma caninum]|uniref:Uncharacterized protein n=1 Tax=Ancylostoma caninum TaxID=29170 RepID=A0A368GCM7_ANCCA|nr:hypothetical protein ANCCAN_12567 [Ancylostoma caninum]